MNLSGLDLATRLCGWTSGDGSTIPATGCWELPQVEADLGRMLDVFDRLLVLHIEAYRPEAIVYEAPILVVNDRNRGTDKLLTIRKIYSLGGHVEFVCKRLGIECAEVGLKQIKKEVTGDSHAQKDALVAIARRCGLELPPGPGAKDAADSWGAWLLALRHFDKGRSAEWDSRIWSRRGGLT